MKINSNKKQFLFIATALLVLATVFVVYAYITKTSFFTPDPFERTINYGQSDSEKKRQQELKSNPQEKLENGQTDRPQEPSISSETSKYEANVVITYAGLMNEDVSVSGFVSNISEDEGQCIFVFQKDTLVVKKTVSVLSNSTSTTCKSLKFNKTELGSGKWIVRLEYSSDKSYGTAKEQLLNDTGSRSS
jgi:hypothetical protein